MRIRSLKTLVKAIVLKKYILTLQSTNVKILNNLRKLSVNINLTNQLISFIILLSHENIQTSFTRTME
jgi:hypothetical protein